MKLIYFLVLLLFSVFLAACVQSKTLRKADYIIVSSDVQGSKKFFGIAKATSSANLSFQSEGKIIFLPFAKGDFVKKGQIIARLDGILYLIKKNEEEAKLKEYIVQKQKQNKFYKRLDLLHKEGAISDNDWESAFYELKIIDQQISIQKEKINYIDKQISNNVIIAPYNAYIDEKFLDVDSYAKLGSPVVSIIGANSLQVEVMVDEYMVNSLFLGQNATISIMNFKYKGVIEHISKSSGGSGGYLVKIKILDKTDKLKEGMRGEVEFDFGYKNNIIYLPISAILEESNKKFVFIIENTGVIRKIKVETGNIFDSNIQILNGLKSGDIVIKEPSLYQESEKVEI